MDEQFDVCCKLLIVHEGKLANNLRDPGGITNFGISLRYLQGLGSLGPDGYLLEDMDHDGDIDAEDIKQMTPEKAKEIYKPQWRDRYYYGQIGYLPLAFKVFDFSVNAGPKRAGIILQQVLNRLFSLHLKEDGEIGLMTLTALNGCNDVRLLLANFKLAIINFYVSLNKDIFLEGWVRRALDDLSVEA